MATKIPTILYICVLELICHMLQILYILFIDEPLLGLGIRSIVGIVVGLLCAIVIIVIVIVCLRKRRNRKDESIDGMSYLPNNSDTFCVIFF
jgi:preprotein translocase subunit SecF